MKDCKENKKLINRLRKYCRKVSGKKNGVIGPGLMDHPDLEIKYFKNKNRYRRKNLK